MVPIFLDQGSTVDKKATAEDSGMVRDGDTIQMMTLANVFGRILSSNNGRPHNQFP